MAFARDFTRHVGKARRAAPQLWPILLVLGAFATGTPARSEEGLLDWIVQSISVDEEGAVIRAALSTPPEGSTLTEGQRISTGPGQQMVLSNGRDLVTLQPGTSVEIGDSDPTTPDANLDLLSGTVHVEAGKRSNGDTLSIETPYLVATVKGTQFDVSTSSELSAVSVTEGVVGVDATATRRGLDVLPGKTAIVSRLAADFPNLIDTPVGGAAGIVGGDMDMANGDLTGIGGSDTASLGTGETGNGGIGGGGTNGGGSSGSGSSGGGSGGIGGAVGDATGAVGGAVSDASEAVGGAVSDTTGALGDAVGGAVGDTVSGVGGAVGGAVGGIGGAVGGAVGGLGGALGGDRRK